MHDVHDVSRNYIIFKPEIILGLIFNFFMEEMFNNIEESCLDPYYLL